MPKIVTYNNQLFPSAAPMAEAAGAAASGAYYIGKIMERGFGDLELGVTQFQNGMAKRDDAAKKLAEQEDIANLTAAYAVNNADMAVKWNQTLKGADPSKIHDVQQQFMQDATNGYNAIHESAKTDAGRLYSTEARAKSFSSQYISTSADAMNVSSEQAAASIAQLSTNYSAAAYHDPGSYKAQIDQFDLAIDAQSTSNDLSPSDALKLKNSGHMDIARSSIKGMIENNPVAAKEAIDKGAFDGVLPGPELAKAGALADTTIIRKQNGVTAQANAEEKQQTTAATKAYSDLVASQPVDDKTGHVMIQPDFFTNVQKIPNLPAPQREAAMRWGITEMHRTDKVIEGPSDQMTKDNFVKQVDDGTLNKHSLDVARANNLLNQKDYGMLSGMVAGSKTDTTVSKALNKFVGGMKTLIAPAGKFGLEDSWGKERWNTFQSDSMLKISNDIAAGKPPEQIQKEIKDMVPAYQVDPKQVKAEQAIERAGKLPPKGAPAVVPRKSMNDLFDQHSENDIPANNGSTMVASYTGPAKMKTADGGLPAVSGNAYPALLGTQPGRQPLDMSKVVPSVMSKWERVQGILGQQFPIVSAYRDPKVNAKAGGAKGSEHLKGEALDIDMRNIPIPQRIKLLQVAGNMGFTGIGVYPNSIHLDLGRSRMWGPDHTHSSIPDWAKSIHAQQAVAQND